jgi:hypothetical protein
MMDEQTAGSVKEQAAASKWVEEEFSKVLGIPASAGDDFFALGGTSLAAAKLATRLAARSGKAVSIVDVIRSRTPEAMVACLAQASAVPASPAASGTPGGPGPVSHSQRWYSWVHRGDAQSRAIICFSTELPDGTDVSAVRAALIAVADRYDALRMRVTPTADGLVQQVMPSDAVSALLHGDGPDGQHLLRVVEAGGQRDEVARAAAQVQVQEQSRGMPLGHGPLFRAVFVRGDGPAGQQPGQLVLTVHHFVFDGTSQGIFMQKIREACRNPADLSGPSASYYQYVLSSLRHEQEWEGGAADRWWRSYLSGFEGRCHLPVRHAGDAHPTWAIEGTLPARLYQALALRSKEYRVPVSFLRLAALLILVHALYDTPDAVVCMPVDGRGPAWANTIGMFIDCVALRHRARSPESVHGMIDGISSDMIRVMEYRDIGFDRVAGAANRGEVEERYPISGVIMNGAAGDTAGPQLDTLQSNPMGRKMLFDLQFYFSDFPDRVDVELQHRSELLTRAEGARLLTIYWHVLSRVAESGAEQIQELVSDARERLALSLETR